MKCRIIRNVYTFEEVSSGFNDERDSRWEFNVVENLGNAMDYFSNSNYASLCTKFYEILTPIEEEGDIVGFNFKDDVINLINDIYNEWHDYIAVVINKEEPTNEDKMKACSEFLYSLLNTMNITAPRYLNLLKYYKDKENLLLASITTTTHGDTRFNDTPQNQGEFDDDTHNTNVTKSDGVVESDVSSPMERIKQIQEAYRNLMRDWRDEFKSFFIAPSNFTEVVE